MYGRQRSDVLSFQSLEVLSDFICGFAGDCAEWLRKQLLRELCIKERSVILNGQFIT